MSGYPPQPPTPVVYDGADGSPMVNPKKLVAFCDQVDVNMRALAIEIGNARADFRKLHATNTKLIQFMNWLAVTNPQILDEFQNTANAFDKLSPRDDGGEATAYAAP